MPLNAAGLLTFNNLANRGRRVRSDDAGWDPPGPEKRSCCGPWERDGVWEAASAVPVAGALRRAGQVAGGAPWWRYSLGTPDAPPISRT